MNCFQNIHVIRNIILCSAFRREISISLKSIMLAFTVKFQYYRCNIAMISQCKMRSVFNFFVNWDRGFESRSRSVCMAAVFFVLVLFHGVGGPADRSHVIKVKSSRYRPTVA
jgi:hypothetical protein